MADNILRLKVESSEYDAKLKKAAEGLQHLAKAAHDCGGDLINLEKDEVAFIREMGSMNTSAKTAAGSIREMESTLKAMTLTYKQMSDAEKSGDAGKALSDAMSELKSRLIPAKQALADTEKEMRKLNQEVSASQNPFGQYGSIIDNIGSRFGITGNLTELLTSKTALMTAGIGASIAIVTKATEAWADYNAELAKQDQITTVTTGLKGEDANKMTDFARSLVDTYNVDFREAINAANTLMTQFGQTGDEAIQLLRDGMQGMIQGDGPKLLQMIQQYAPAFRDAGVSASQLVAVIQNSEGGIFTDQNMNAIVMGIKNIRLMTKPTSDALAQLGIDGQKMSQQLSDGTLTIFDALKQVATAIQGVDSNSKAAGEVMQQVFGRQGAMAGTKLGEAIATLNTNLEETKKQTGEVGDALADLQTANERLNTAIREAFGYDGWEQMATGIKTKLIGALADVIEHLAIIEEGFGKISKFFGGGGNKPSGIGYKDVEDAQTWINNGKDDNERRRRYEKAIADLQKKLNNVGKERAIRNSDGSTSYVIDDEETQAKKRAALQKRMSMLYATSYTEETKIKPNKPIPGSGGGKNTITEEKGDFTEIIGLIGNAQERVSDLQRQIRESWDQNEIVNLRKKLKDAQNELDVLQGKLPKDTVVDITVDANTAEALQMIDDIEGVTIAPKTVEITATDEALPLLNEIDGVTITPKTFSITATEEAMPKLREIQGVTIDPKTLAITATDEALPKLREIQGVTIDPKTFTITATDEALPLLNEIDGVTFDPKNVTVTADTTEALQRIQKLVAETNGTIIETKVVPVNTDEDIKRSLREQGVTTNAMSAWAGAQKKSLGDTEVGSNEYTDISANIVDTETLSNLLQKATEAGLTNVAENINAEGLWESILNGENIPDEVWESIVEEMNDALSELGVDPIKLDVDTGKVIKDVKKVEKEVKGISTAASTVSSVVGSIGQAFNSIEDPAAKVAGTVAQAIATLAAGYATATTQASSMGPWAWIAFAATGLATLISTVSSIHNITGYAQGGIVQGNTFSGDQVGPVMLDAGEVVLNRSQVGNLAAQLEDSRIGGDGGSQPYVSGEMIYLGMNNYLKRSGRGEIITSRK